MNNISKKWQIIFIVILGFIIAPYNASALPSVNKKNQSESNGSTYTILKYLLPALKKSSKAGRFYYAKSCQVNENYSDLLPNITVRHPSNGNTGLSEIREIFREDKHAKITERPFGIIRITIGNLSNALLDTRISSITLDPIEQYNPLLGISAIEKSVDVRAAMDKLNLHVTERVSNQAITMPADGLPHLPGTIANVTMDQALDLVAQTFGGVVVYGACTNSNSYEIDFTGGAGFDDSKLR